MKSFFILLLLRRDTRKAACAIAVGSTERKMKIEWSKPVVAYCDGGSRGNPGLSACAFAVYVGGDLVVSRARFLGKGKTNNYAEWSGILDLLEWLAHNLPQRVRATIFSDSELVVNQITGKWAVKHPELQPLAAKATYIVVKGQYTVAHCRGHNGIVGNELCDELCNEEMDKYDGKGDL